MQKKLIDRGYIAKSSLMAASNLLQFATASLTLLLIARYLGQEAANSYGATLALVSLLLMLPAGLMIWQISTLAPVLGMLKQSKGQMREKNLLEVARLNHSFSSYTLLVALILAGAWLLLFLLLNQLDFFVPELWLTLLPWLLVSPWSASCQAKLQLAQQERTILVSSLLASGTNLASLYFYFFLSTSQAASTQNLAAVGAIFSFTSLALLIFLTSRVKALPASMRTVRRDRDRPSFQLATLKQIVYGALDGIVLSTVFGLALIFASQTSSEDGFILSLVISIMRMIVIPSKQFGLVGGRMYAMGQVKSIRTVLCSSLFSLLLITLLLIPAYSLLSPVQIPGLLLLLMLIQVALEPLAGVLYGFLKISRGPDRAIGGLVGSYLCFALPLLSLLAFAGWATASLCWGLLFLTRLIFMVSVLWAFRTSNRSH